MDFKLSTRNKLIIAANEYNKLVGIDFVVQSDKFLYKKEYILRFHKDNFLHLTGVGAHVSANDFYEKCLNGTIEIEDFNCDSTNELKGKIKEKLRNLSEIGSFFEKELVFQEKFEKNRVKCNIATSDGKCTLGFINIAKNIHVPLTLLNRKQIDEKNQITDFTIVIKKNSK